MASIREKVGRFQIGQRVKVKGRREEGRNFHAARIGPNPDGYDCDELKGTVEWVDHERQTLGVMGLEVRVAADESAETSSPRVTPGPELRPGILAKVSGRAGNDHFVAARVILHQAPGVIVEEIQGDIRAIDAAKGTIQVAGFAVKVYDHTKCTEFLDLPRPRLAPQSDRLTSLLSSGAIKPVVIGCSAASGSRLLRDILAASRQIYMDKDCNQASKDSRGSQVFLGHDRQRTSSELHELVGSFMNDILAQIPGDDLSQYRWFGWKNPRNLRVVDELMLVHPQLHFLHLIRNPAALVNSALPRRFYERNRAVGHPDAQFGLNYFVLTRWVRANLPVWRRYRENPRYRLVRYEDLVTTPRKTIESLFAWLGVEVEAWRDAVPFVSPPADGLSRALGVPLDLIEDAAAELGYVAAASANGGNQTMEGHTLRLGDA